jgi:hypothetical protein
MKNKDDKRKDEELRRQQEADRAASNAALTTAAAPSPLQAAEEEDALNFRNWEQGKGAYAGQPIDVMNAPGLGPSLSLYRRARAGQQGERAGIGALRLGLNASDPGMAANLAEQSNLRRDQDAAGALEEAVAAKTAEAHNSVLPLIQLNQSRALGVAGLRSGQAQQTQGLWSQYRVRPGWGANLLNGLVQGAAGTASAYAGNPAAFS